MLRSAHAALALILVAGCQAAPPSGGPPPATDGRIDPTRDAPLDEPGPATDPGTGQPDPVGKGAVPGGTISTPPVCAVVGADLRLTNAGAVQAFALRWDTDRYVLAYSDEATGAGDIYVGAWKADGTPAEPARLVEGTALPSREPSLTKTASGFVVAWEEASSPRSIRLSQIDSAGRPTGVIATAGYSVADEARPVVTEAPGGIAVTWMSVTDGIESAHVGLLDGDLALTGPAVRLGPATTRAVFPWIVGDAVSLAAVWSDGRDGVLDLRFARLDPQMDVMAEAPLRAASNDARLGRVIKTSFGYLAAWEDDRSGDNEIYMALTDSLGAKLVEGLVEEPMTGDANWPNMAWNGSEAGIVYYQWRGGTPQIYMSFVDAMGKRVGDGADVQVSRNPMGWARYPDVQWTGSEFGVAWIDTRDGAPQVYFNRVRCR